MLARPAIGSATMRCASRSKSIARPPPRPRVSAVRLALPRSASLGRVSLRRPSSSRRSFAASRGASAFSSSLSFASGDGDVLAQHAR